MDYRTKQLLIFVAGTLTGALAMQVYLKKKDFRRMDEVEKELEDAYEYYEHEAKANRAVIESQRAIIATLENKLEYKGMTDDLGYSNSGENYNYAYQPAAINEGYAKEDEDPVDPGQVALNFLNKDHETLTEKLDKMKPDILSADYSRGGDMDERGIVLDENGDVLIDEEAGIFGPDEDELAYEQQMAQEGGDYVEEIHLKEGFDVNVNPADLDSMAYDEMITLTWYAGDDILADERSEMIPDPDMVVGPGTLQRLFNGEGVVSQDEIIVYNYKHDQAYNIVRDNGSYTKEVLGYEH